MYQFNSFHTMNRDNSVYRPETFLFMYRTLLFLFIVGLYTFLSRLSSAWLCADISTGIRKRPAFEAGKYSPGAKIHSHALGSSGTEI